MAVKSAEKVYRVGVDVGGTNTDCIVLHPGEANEETRGIRGAFKTPTTADVTNGITDAINGALANSSVSRDAVAAVMIGTTHFINAVVQADNRNLAKVGVLRLCGPYTGENPAFSDFPPILERIMNGHVAYLRGGMEVDGRQIMPLDEEEIRRECQTLREKKITHLAIVGVFSPLDTEGLQEARVKDIVQEEIPEASIVCSRDIGNLGFLERENATIMNASILRFARRTINGFAAAMKSLGLSCPLFLTQNDGTIIDAESAKAFPIKTFSSGPTNSMTGAAYLSGLDQEKGRLDTAPVIVADIGGTTTDVCALLPSGFPRQSGTWVEIGGVRSAFSMPEVTSFGLGGGTKVYDYNGDIVVGPESVGHFLTSKALVFGGDTLTASDIVVASKAVDMGDASKVAHLSPDLIKSARHRMKCIIEEAVDCTKLTAEPATVILVGGGSIVQMDELEGVAKTIRPPFHDCANAVGAAMAKVSGEVDVVKILEGSNEDDIITEVSAAAIKKAIQAGADPKTVKVVSIDNMPLQYVSVRATRLVIKAAGLLGAEALQMSPVKVFNLIADVTDEISHSRPGQLQNKDKDLLEFTSSPSANLDIAKYRPEVDIHGTWWISEVDCEFLATGCSVLGCGGGGPGYTCYLAARAAIKAGKKLRVVDINTLPEDGWVLASAAYGAPVVTTERLPSGTEAVDATDSMLAYHHDMKPTAMISVEIGGMNGIRPILTGVHYDIPTIDGDYMGRAYPRLYLATPYLFGHDVTPCIQADGVGNSIGVYKSSSFHRAEKIHRKAAIELGLFSQLAIAPLTVAETKKVGTLGTTSLAWRIGRAVYLARQKKTSIIKSILEANPSGKLLYSGKIVNVRRYVSSGGYSEGSVRLKMISSEEREYGEEDVSETRDMVLPFQNEYLYAGLQNSDGTEEVLAMVPDLISLIGQDGYALGTQDIKYGVRVNVVAFVAHPHWYTPRGIHIGGLREFGYEDMEFKPLGPGYHEPVSVMDEYRPRISANV